MNKLIAVVGETASGKSALALKLAKQFDGEIINADSWQIYRGMDIGTSKPSLEERKLVPHHLFDIVDPDEDFNAAMYKRMAMSCIEEIQAREKLPIMVGGTGLYIDGVVFDYSFLPPGDDGLRARLQSLTIPELIAQAEDKGYPLTGVDIRNKRRLVRLIESEGKMPTSRTLREDTLMIGVAVSRAALRRNIERRVEVMFRRGLKHEVEELAHRYGWEAEAMKGIGYRELKGYFEGTLSNQQTKRKVIKSTLELAKRQRTWFKRNQEIRWVEGADEAVPIVNEFLKKV